MNLKKLAIAAALVTAAAGAHADTLVAAYSGSIAWTVDETHSAELAATVNGILASDASFSTFSGYLVIDNYENYLSGTYTLNFVGSDSPVSLALYNPMMRGIEGANSNPTVPNPSYVEGVANCTTRGGCDFDGDGVVETPRNNNPQYISAGAYAVTPDNSQLGDGSVTLVDGKIVDITYYSVATAGSLVKNTEASWAPASTENAADSLNAFLARQGWQTRVESIDMTVNAFNASTMVADGVYLTTGLLGTANVEMTAAIPEPETYAMLLSGLGLIGMAARRRIKSAA